MWKRFSFKNNKYKFIYIYISHKNIWFTYIENIMKLNYNLINLFNIEQILLLYIIPFYNNLSYIHCKKYKYTCILIFSLLHKSWKIFKNFIIFFLKVIENNISSNFLSLQIVVILILITLNFKLFSSIIELNQ